MSLKVTLLIGCTTAAVFAAVLVAAETALPLASKPSILLRVNAGTLPTADLTGVYAIKEARAKAAAQDAASVKANLAVLQTANAVVQQASRALEDRIREKQATDWAVMPTVSAP